MRVEDITPAIMVKNEEYWIYYVLKDVLSIFPKVIMLDTGSTDATKDIARTAAKTIGGNLELIEADYGADASLIGAGRNLLRERVETKWMFLIDGDEVWTQPQLDNLLSRSVPEGIKVVMAGSHNLEDIGGVLKKRTYDVANKDILFASDVRWKRLDYPFEGYGLGNDLPMELVYYFPADKVYCYHMRHTKRSGRDGEAFFRKDKYNYFPYDKGHEDFPVELLGKTMFYNPYVKLKDYWV